MSCFLSRSGLQTTNSILLDYKSSRIEPPKGGCAKSSPFRGLGGPTRPVVAELQSVTIENGVCNPVADYKSAPHLRRDFKSRRTSETPHLASPLGGERNLENS